jgi:hypothetical protein
MSLGGLPNLGALERDAVTTKEVVTVVKTAVQEIEDIGYELRTMRKISPGSNIWKVQCSAGEVETEFTLYVFPDATPEELTRMTRDRLSLHIPRWQTTQGG